MRMIVQLLLSFAVLAAPLAAQDQAEAARNAAGCGPNETSFTVKTQKNQHPTAQPEPGKALVYVFGDEDIDNVTLHIGSSVTRWGLDGTWTGANERKSYFYFPVEPGEHRLCTRRQSGFKSVNKISAALSFTAEAGKVYYFRTKTPHPEHVGRSVPKEDQVTLVALDPAEAQLLIANSAFSVSRPRPADKSSHESDSQ